MAPYRVLIVDNSPIFLGTAERLVASFSKIVIVGVATSGREALEQAALLQPDLVLMDLVMPDVNGLEVARQLAKWPVAPRVILMTFHDNPEYRAAAMGAGAHAFLNKSDLATRLIPLIHELIPVCGRPHGVDPLRAGAPPGSVANS